MGSEVGVGIVTSDHGVSSSALGGQNNELGSSYRAGVAAYLAAHSLSSQPAAHLALDDANLPLVIKVESDEAVDDLLSESAGRRLLIQSKRTCGIDRSFRKTVDQWVAAVKQGDVGADDSVVLVTRRAKGLLVHLNAALARRRNPDAQEPGPNEQRALDALLNAVDDRLDDRQLDLLLDAAIVIELAVENKNDAAFREAARLLEGSVVPVGQGLAAMNSLQHHFQSLGASRWASNRDRWREVLREANLELLSDLSGGWSARQSATQAELDAYRSKIAERLGEFPLNSLTPDLPPMRLEDLVGTFQVSIPDSGERSVADDFAAVCRRWGRLVVVGLPGSGKSTALEQLAASWASQDGAPIPLVVELRPLARQADQDGRPVTLDRLVENAVATTGRDASVLVPELVHRCKSGEAALLLDGLDECRGAAAAVADDVVAIIALLPESTSLILTTRASALPAASKLGLPEVELVEPLRLQNTLELLLEHVAHQRVEEPDRESWIKERSQRLEELRSETSELIHVPLMAILLVLLISEEDTPAPGVGRAELLWEVVKGSVNRWEASRNARDPSAERHDDNMLLRAFAEIGHSIAGLSSPNTRSAVVEAVARCFEDGWDRAHRDAMTEAERAVSFWDDQVGVFVSMPPNYVLEARSNVFVEVADAAWVVEQPDPLQRTWLSDALPDPDRHDVVLLAADLSPNIVDLLLEYAKEDRTHALELAADAIAGSRVPAIHIQKTLVNLIEAKLSASPNALGPKSGANSPFQYPMTAFSAGQTKRDDAEWPLLRRLAQLPLNQSFAERRAQILDDQESDEQRVLGRALSAVSQIAARGGEPTKVELRHMISLLQTPLPESGATSRRVSRRHTVMESPSWSPLSGFGDALVGCARWLPTLDAELARVCCEAAQRTSMRHARMVERLLSQAGHDAVVSEMWGERVDWMSNFHADDPWRSMRTFYVAVAESAPQSELTLSEAWSMESLGELVALIGLAELAVGELAEALTHSRSEIEFLLPLYARWADLEARTLASQAAFAAEAHDRGADSEMVELLFVPIPPRTGLGIRPADIDVETRDRLIAILRGGVELPFKMAARLLGSAEDQELAVVLRDMLREVPTWHRGRAAFLAAVVSEDQTQTAVELLSHEDRLVKVAAAGLVARMIGEEAEDRDIRLSLESVAGAEDFSMRAAMFKVLTDRNPEGVHELIGLASSPPAYWTCCDCGQRQVMTSVDCEECSTGTRMNLPKPVGDDLEWYVHPM